MTAITLQGSFGTYRVGNLLATTQTYRVYLAREEYTGMHYLLQVAATPESNGGLDRAAFLLQRLKTTADLFDAEYARTHKDAHLHYDRLYPEVIESELSPEQGGRRINILSLTDVEDVRSVIPLSNLRTKDRVRLDPETSAWVMGRLLKLLTFVHDEGIANQALTAKNVLLDPERHFAVTLDWSTARIFPSKVPPRFAVFDIADAAKAVFASIGGNTNSGDWTYDGHVPYVQFLWHLAQGKEKSAERAMDKFYELVRSEYGKSFHPFTTLSL